MKTTEEFWGDITDSINQVCETIYSFITDPIVKDFIDELNQNGSKKDDDVIEVYEVKKELPETGEKNGN